MNRFPKLRRGTVKLSYRPVQLAQLTVQRPLPRIATKRRTILSQTLRGPPPAREQTSQGGMGLGRTRRGGNRAAQFPLRLVLLAGFHQQHTQVASDFAASRIERQCTSHLQDGVVGAT